MEKLITDLFFKKVNKENGVSKKSKNICVSRIRLQSKMKIKKKQKIVLD